MSKIHQLYRHFSADDELLYVGITSRLPNRLREHEKHTGWWKDIKRIEIEVFGSRELLLEAEKTAIVDERPKYNVHHNCRQPSIDIPCPLKKSQENITRQVVTLKPLYRLKEAAELLGISTTTLRRAIDNGELNCVEITLVSASHQFVSGWQLIDWLEELGAKP